MPRMIFLTFLVLGIVPVAAHAHALGVSCMLRGDKVEVEVFYDDDTPAINAKVEVLDANEKVTLSGMTDTQGRWTFAVPAAGQYQVRADAGAGHRAKTSFTVPATVETLAPVVISDGPTREEITRFPWLKVAIGVAVLGGIAVAFMIAPGLRKKDARSCEH